MSTSRKPRRKVAAKSRKRAATDPTFEAGTIHASVDQPQTVGDMVIEAGVSETVKVRQSVRWPATWWDAVKERWFPAWLEVSFPVRWEERVWFEDRAVEGASDARKTGRWNQLYVGECKIGEGSHWSDGPRNGETIMAGTDLSGGVVLPAPKGERSWGQVGYDDGKDTPIWFRAESYGIKTGTKEWAAYSKGFWAAVDKEERPTA